ncbi:MAG: hypothetical protein PQJ59_03070 [Spirochaetales bacterium]|nr:hypothetical protein [Spirochaetales bacterium]
MRLTQFEIDAIKSSFKKIYHEGKLYVFGSRLDDNEKGGDIDLYLCPEQNGESSLKKRQFLVDLKQKIGDQKIDVILSRDSNRYIEKDALSRGVEL